MQISEVLTAMRSPSQVPVISEDDYRRRASCLLARLKTAGDLEIDPKEIFYRTIFFAAILSYAIRDGSRRPKKGLIIFGQVGCGKTTLVDRVFSELGVKRFTAQGIIRDYLEYDDSARYYRRYYGDRDVVLDDLGAEPSRVQKYGMPYGLAEWLQWRYECYKRHGVLTVITTNLQNADDLTRLYGARITSRIREMCAPVLYNHHDRRR